MVIFAPDQKCPKTEFIQKNADKKRKKKEKSFRKFESSAQGLRERKKKCSWNGRICADMKGEAKPIMKRIQRRKKKKRAQHKQKISRRMRKSTPLEKIRNAIVKLASQAGEAQNPYHPEEGGVVPHGWIFF